MQRDKNRKERYSNTHTHGEHRSDGERPKGFDGVHMHSVDAIWGLLSQGFRHWAGQQATMLNEYVSSTSRSRELMTDDNAYVRFHETSPVSGLAATHPVEPF